MQRDENMGFSATDIDSRGNHVITEGHRALKGRSSLRLAGENAVRPLRHTPLVPGQTRTWSSIETIAAQSEVKHDFFKLNGLFLINNIFAVTVRKCLILKDWCYYTSANINWVYVIVYIKNKISGQIIHVRVEWKWLPTTIFMNTAK